MVVRLACVALLLCVKFLPDCCLNSLDLIWVRLLLHVSVALLFSDVLSA